MAGCDDTRQLTETQRQAAYQQQRTGVMQAVRPFSGRPTIENLIDYINRELQPAVKATRNKVNDIYRPSVDNAPSGNPLGFYFSTSTVAADPTVGRIRLNAATQDTATVIRVSESNGRLVNVAPWLDVMAGSVTSPLGVVTLTDALDPGRFIRFDLTTMVDQGVYWDLTVSPIESSHDNPFIEGGPVVLSFIPGVGGNTAATVPASSISGADGPRQFLSTSTGLAVDFRTLSAIFPGAPIYDVMAYPFNATGSLAGNDTTAVNAAIAAANLAPGIVYLGPAHRITAALTAITNNNVWIVGRGPFNGGTILQVDSASAVHAVTISGCQYSGVRDVWITGTRVFSGGFAVRIVDCFRARAENILISQYCFGIEVFRSTLTDLDMIFMDDLYGVYGIYAHGDATAFNHAVRIYRSVGGTNYGAAVVGKAGTWAAGTAYVIGNIVFSNGAIYMASTNGTSGATAPSGIPGSTPATAHTATVSDGGVSWKFQMPLGTWYLQGSWSHTFEVIDCGALQGGYGLSVEDDTPGVNSTPFFTRVQNLQVDHPFARGVRLAAGVAARFYNTFVTSVLEGVGIEVGSGYSGNWEFEGGEVFGCSREGVLINKGNGLLQGMQIGAVGTLSSGTIDAISVGNSASGFTITGCSAGDMYNASTTSRYGCAIAAGCTNYVIQGNRFIGNLTGPILNTPGQAITRVVRGNVPKYAEHNASDAYESFTLAAGTHTLTLLATTNTVFITPSGAGDVVIDTIIHGASNAGVILTIVKQGFTGAVVLDDTNVGVNSIWCPATADFRLNAYNDSVTLESMFDRWRPRSPARTAFRKNSGGADFVRRRYNLIEGTGVTLTFSDDPTNEELDVTIAASTGLTDGDKGDITVSSSGTVWTIDNSVVTLAKQADLAQSRFIGRAEGAGTGAPQALTPTQAVAIIDAEDATWTGNHAFTGSIHTVGTTGDVSIASASGGLWMSAGHTAVAPPSVSNGDVLISASSGVSVYAGATPVTGVAANEVLVSSDGAVNLTSVNINLTSTNVAATTTGTITLGAGTTLTLAGGTEVLASSPLRVSNSFTLDAVLTTAVTAADNLVIGNVSVVRFTGGPSPLTGMVPVYAGQTVLMVNAHATLGVGIFNENTSSTSTHRFAGVGTSRTIKPGEMALAWYDSTSSRWRVLCRDDDDL